MLVFCPPRGLVEPTDQPLVTMLGLGVRLQKRFQVSDVFLSSTSQLRNGNIHYISDAGVLGKVERTIGDAALSDGQWHTLRLLRNGSATLLQVDGSHSRLIQHSTQDFGGLAVLTVSLGGIPPGPAQQKTAAGERPRTVEPLTSKWSHVQ